MNGDSLELMQALGTIHADLKQDIGDLKAEVAGFKGAFTSDLKAANVRMKNIEDDMKDQKFWGNVKASSGPFLVALHIVAHKLGIKV
jgi:hypothetical protein